MNVTGDVILFYHNIGHSHEIYDSFLYDSESNEDLSQTKKHEPILLFLFYLFPWRYFILIFSALFCLEYYILIFKVSH